MSEFNHNSEDKPVVHPRPIRRTKPTAALLQHFEKAALPSQTKAINEFHATEAAKRAWRFLPNPSPCLPHPQLFPRQTSACILMMPSKTILGDDRENALPKAAAWLGPSPDFGPAWAHGLGSEFREPEPLEAKPKLGWNIASQTRLNLGSGQSLEARSKVIARDIYGNCKCIRGRTWPGRRQACVPQGLTITKCNCLHRYSATPREERHT
ncbi:uncharacterized protein EDB93DRAFT_1103905 [Suillus bovinus]|uniref:uncharacterized protein n=1 Tax=Suillus bovinus TaxID=48563 RepID=UPI001B876872|nr:uncharacterized protein EDB93DRAFT_1103905 [Suillus bovinus]KAG2147818.1 hypothetical protein EDB93DRAFT_1103905 [Suillus bovinus]